MTCILEENNHAEIAGHIPDLDANLIKNYFKVWGKSANVSCIDDCDYAGFVNEADFYS